MSVYFVADLHLSPETTKITAHFIKFCAELQSGDSLYILGDFFAYFVEPSVSNDLHVFLKKHFNALKTKGIEVFFMHGNRDFLLTSQMANFFGFKLIRDQEVLEINNHKILLLHGDELCTLHKSYILFRKFSRCLLHQKIFFLLTTYSYRQALAKRMRENSRRNFAKQNYVRENIDLNEAYLLLKKNKCDILIHGHTHNASMLDINNLNALIFDTGDWHNESYSFIKIEHHQNKPQLITRTF